MNHDPGSQVGWCERLYEIKASELILYGRALGLSHCEAEDVLQETFLALLKQAEPPAQAEHYCVRTYRHRALNYRRSVWRRLAREFESRRWFERAEPESERELAAMRCLAQLPMEQREAIVLKIWHQCTFEEIGQLLDVSPNTVAGRYRYGLKKLQAFLLEFDYEQNESVGKTVAPMDTAATVAET